jgi:hypothetical protein
MRLVRMRFLALGLGLMTYQAAEIAAEEVMVESPAGQIYVLQVHPEDSFLDVVGAMPAYFETEESFPEVDFETPASFRVCLLAQHTPSASIAKRMRGEARNYSAGTTTMQASDIGYIIKTLANSSLPKIKSAESSLKKAGDRIDVVHPLQFLICVFSDEELKVCLRNLQGRTWVWKDFLSGITDTLAEEDARGNVLPYIYDYANKVGVDANELLPIVQSGKWERFVNRSIELVPRAPGSNRYNM